MECFLQNTVEANREDNFCLFLLSEDISTKSVMLCLIASQGAYLSPVGLVEGKPGGLG